MRLAMSSPLKRAALAIRSLVSANDKSFFASEKYKRIYHVHVRKCGGTSVNMMFLKALSEDGDAQETYDALSRHPTHRVECSGVPIVAWSKAQIESGAFGYGFSHIPFHELDLPRGTYTFLLLRDPAARVLSHYSMLRYFIDNDIAHPCLKTEGHWAADGFDRFLERVPRAHLERQVYTFDPDCDLDKALDGVARVSNVKVLANLDSLVADINDEFQLNLAPIHTRKASNPFRPDDSQRQRLEALLENEYRFLERVRRERVI